jgi:hypothetical protein
VQNTVQSTVRIGRFGSVGITEPISRDNQEEERERECHRRKKMTDYNAYSLFILQSVNATGCLAWPQERSLDVQTRRSAATKPISIEEVDNWSTSTDSSESGGVNKTLSEPLQGCQSTWDELQEAAVGTGLTGGRRSC